MLVTLRTEVIDGVQRAIFSSPQSPGHWYAETKVPLTPRQRGDLSAWDTPPLKINYRLIAPPFDPANMTVAGKEGDIYIKGINILEIGLAMFAKPYLSEVMFREIQTCEALSKDPHPNVCFYRGVQVDNGLVTGLVFDHLDGNLADLVEDKMPFDMEKCLSDVTQGLAHLHSLGFVHCDVKPENIFVEYVDEHHQRFVLGDFDATHREGTLLTLKCGTLGWVPEDEYTECLALHEIDMYSLDTLRIWLKDVVQQNPSYASSSRLESSITRESKEYLSGDQGSECSDLSDLSDLSDTSDDMDEA